MKRGFTLVEFVTCLAIIAILALGIFGPSYACEQQAKLMGMKYDWSAFQGCMIQPKPGQWVPLKNYRVL